MTVFNAGLARKREKLQADAQNVVFGFNNNPINPSASIPVALHEDTSPTVNSSGALSLEFKVISTVTSADTTEDINRIAMRIQRQLYTIIRNQNTESSDPVAADIQDGFLVIADGASNRVDIYNTSDWSLSQSLTSLANAPVSVALSPDNEHLAVVFADQVAIYDNNAGTFESPTTVLINTGVAHKAVWSKDSGFLAILTNRDGSNNSRLWVVTNAGVSEETINEGSVDWRDCDWNNDGSILMAVTNNKFFSYNTSTWAEDVSFNTNSSGCAFTLDGEHAVITDRSNLRIADSGALNLFVLQPIGGSFLTGLSSAGQDKVCAVDSGGTMSFFQIRGLGDSVLINTSSAASPQGASSLTSDYSSDIVTLCRNVSDGVFIFDFTTEVGKGFFLTDLPTLNPTDGDIAISQEFVLNQL